MADKLVRVECYAGYQGDERPVRVFLDGGGIEVACVEDRWYSPGSTYFRVLLTTGERYVLCRQEAQDVWTLAARGVSARSTAAPPPGAAPVLTQK